MKVKNLVIRAKRTRLMLPVLESILSEFGRRSGASSPGERFMCRAARTIE